MRVTLPAAELLRTDWSGASEPAPGFRIGRALGRYFALARSGQHAHAAFTTYDEAADEARRQYEEDAWEERTGALNR